MIEFSQLKNVKWDVYRVSNKHKEINNIMCFDIEVSSFFRNAKGEILSQNDILKRFRKLPKNERYNVLSNYFSDCEKGSICYIWQFGIEQNGTFKVYYGRYLQQFKLLLDALNETLSHRAYIYIHNSSYEMQFLRNIFDLENECETFFTDAREPLYFRYGNIEFRCSYRLTNLSLKAWGEQTEETKKSTMDYGIIRTPKTKLNKKILDYAEKDILVMWDGLRKYREQYNYIGNIPYTQTGKPRREIKQLFHNDKNYHERITKELPINANEYKIQKKCYGGGLTIANALKIKDEKGNIIIHKNVTNEDIASAYPYQIVTKKFPSGRFRKCLKQFKELDFEKFCYLMMLKIKNVKAKSIKHILPRAKIPIRSGCTFDNGKLVKTTEDGYFVLYCTEIDYLTYKEFYDFDENEVELLECYETTKSYLDKKFVEYVLGLYAGKTTWKNVKEKKEYYQRLKEILNACYGMACTNLLFSPIDLVNGQWEQYEYNDNEMDEKLFDLQCKPYKNIVAFSMGIYVTAYQRNNICKMLLNISDNDYLYTDTDSIKFLRGYKYKKLFEQENKKIIEELKYISELRGIDINLFMPKDIKGVEHPIGLWEEEKPYLKACFAGAKRYCFVAYDEKTKKEYFEIVISGVPKCASEHMTIEEFQDGFIFDNEICENKKNIVTYIDGNNLVGETLNKGKYDEFTVNEYYGINMYPTGYRMKLDKDYIEYLSFLAKKGRNLR